MIDRVRLALTDQCDLACRYCVAEDEPAALHRIEAGFAFELVRWLCRRHGVRYVRLTGGEPLLHPELIPLIERLSALPGLDEVSLTTNGQRLARWARALRDAGLARVNVSLDTLSADRFARLTRGGKLARTLVGIESAIAAGLSPVRINVLVQRGFNEDELPDIAAWGLRRGCVVRFLEVMPIGPLARGADEHLVPAVEILERLSDRFELHPIPRPFGQPAVDHAAHGEGLHGVIGIIASTTKPFCSTCRRIRITAAGRLLTCLFDRQGVGLKSAWNGRVLDEAGADAILHAAVGAKLAGRQPRQMSPMVRIGG